MERSQEAFERALEIQKDTELTSRILGSLGLYNAAFDTYDVPEHPEDSRWAVELDDDSNVERSNN